MSQPPLSAPYDVTQYLGTTPWFPTGVALNGIIQKYVYDKSTSPAATGALLVLGPTNSNWTQSSVAGSAFANTAFGVVSSPASSVGAQATIITRGIINALCTTGSVAIAAGSLLVSDGSGGLTVPAPSAAPTGTAVPSGSTGSTTVTYLAYARNAYGLDSVASSAITTTVSNATLTPANSNVVKGTVASGISSVIIVRTVGGATQGVIGVASVPPGQTQFNFLDWGQTAGAATYTPNATPTFVPGQVLATSLGTLTASTATETLTSVFVGGY